jgi:hypothetical protein
MQRIYNKDLSFESPARRTSSRSSGSRRSTSTSTRAATDRRERQLRGGPQHHPDRQGRRRDRVPGRGQQAGIFFITGFEETSCVACSAPRRRISSSPMRARTSTRWWSRADSRRSCWRRSTSMRSIEQALQQQARRPQAAAEGGETAPRTEPKPAACGRARSAQAMPGKPSWRRAFVEHERRGIAQIEAAAVRAHGIRRQRCAPRSSITCLGQAAGFRAEQQQVAVT